MLARLEYLGLDVRGELGVNWKDQNGGHALKLGYPVGYQEASGLDVLLSRHENEDVTRPVLQVDGQCLLHGSVHIVFLDHLRKVLLHREGTAWDDKDRHSTEEVGKPLSIHSRRGNDELDVSPLLSHLP